MNVETNAAEIQISVLRLHADAQLPRYAHTGPFGDLAADLHAVTALTVEPGQTVPVPTGIALGLPSEYGVLVEDRSGLAVKGITTLAGVIDPGYRGEIKVVMTNISAVAHSICVGDRIAQLRVVRRFQATFTEVSTLEETQRNHSGFGSTGV